jgi:hypothetical protein
MPDHRLFLCFLLLSGALFTPRVAAAADACEQSPFTTAKTGAVATIEVNFELLKKCLDAKRTPDGRITVRLDEDTNVSTKVTHFNFVNYTLAYKVEETVVETYVNLAKLWTQILGLPAGIAQPFSALADECTAFASCLGRWAWEILQADFALNGYLATYQRRVVLTDAEIAQTVTNYQDMQEKVERLKARLDDISKRTPPATVEDVDKFKRVYATHLDLLGRIDAFGAAVDLVENGEVKNVGKKKGGTIVTITITPKTQTQATASPVARIEYFTHSRIPVTFHVGYAYSKLTDVKFETVRSLTQADLFSVVKENTSTNAMVAFLSLGQTIKNGQAGFFGTIGTDLNKPGERVYVGGSLNLFKRLFVSGGWVSGTQQEPQNPVTETIGNALDARELFAVIDPQRRWRGFGAVSFRAF